MATANTTTNKEWEICPQCGFFPDDCTCRKMYCPDCKCDVLAVETSSAPIEYECPVCSCLIPPFSQEPDTTNAAISQWIEEPIIRAANAQVRR